MGLKFNPITGLFDLVNPTPASEVEDTIADGVVDVAPSQNAVHDALAVKASTVLDNLGVTSINADLIGNKVSFTLKSADSAGPTEEVFIKTGDASAGNSGNLTVQTGTATGTRGNLTLHGRYTLLDGISAVTMQGPLAEIYADDIELRTYNNVSPTLKFFDEGGSEYVGLKAPADVGLPTAYTLTLPGSDGAANEAMITDGSGNLSFEAVILASEKGANNGVATLGANGKLTNSEIPAIAITDTFVVASQVAMLALVAETGDVAVRTDLNKSFILKGTDATVLGDWQELLTPTDTILSVNSQTGIVSLDTDDVPEGTNKYFSAALAKAAAVADSITDAITDVAPSQNAVYDALQNKAGTDLSNLVTTSINQSLIPSTSATFNIGSASSIWSTVHTNIVQDSTGDKYLDLSANLQLASYGSNSDNITIGSYENSSSGSPVLNISTGSGTGDTGNINITTGISGTGTQGQIYAEARNINLNATTGYISLSSPSSVDIYDYNEAITVPLRIYNASGYYTGIKSPSGTTSNIDFVLPGSDGSANYIMKTNGTGQLSLVNIATIPEPIVTKNTTFTPAADEKYLICSGTITVNLPAASTNTGKVYIIKNVDTGTITIDANASELIDGATTLTSSTQYQSYTLVCDGTGWHII